jgi:hypothetical protein
MDLIKKYILIHWHVTHSFKGLNVQFPNNFCSIRSIIGFFQTTDIHNTLITLWFTWTYGRPKHLTYLVVCTLMHLRRWYKKVEDKGINSNNGFGQCSLWFDAEGSCFSVRFCTSSQTLLAVGCSAGSFAHGWLLHVSHCLWTGFRKIWPLPLILAN